MENEEFVREFLEESEENLDQLDRDFVALEKQPRDQERLGSIYRTIHTIKGTSGFFGFAKLGAIAHAGENLLSHLRDGVLILDEEITSALLKSVDAIREVLARIGDEGTEGEGDYRELNSRLASLLDKKQSNEEALDAAAASKKTAIPPDETPVATGADSEASGGTQGAVSLELKERDSQENLRRAESLSSANKKAAAEQGSDPTSQTLGDLGNDSEIDFSVRQPSHGNQPFTSPMSDSGDRVEIAPTQSQPEGSGDGLDKTKTTSKRQGGDSGEASKSSSAVSEGTIRVDVGLLNQLMDLVGELVLARNQLMQFSTGDEDRRFTNVSQQVNRITTELQERVMKTRMQPIGNLWGRFPRVVRDLAVACGKEVDLTMDGRDTEVDKSLLEAIKDPLTHLIRNAIDHGFETPHAREAAGKARKGHLHLRAWHQGGQVNIEITDNGRGINPASIRQKAIEKRLLTNDLASGMTEQQIINLIFQPAFSTAEKVTDVSGRGVGMDVVKTNIESIGGTIDIQSRVGIGTTIKIKIPLTLAIVPALLVSSGGERFAIPQVHLVEMLRLDEFHSRNAVEMVRSAPVYRLRGKLLPLVYLNQTFANSHGATEASESCLNIVILQADSCRFGLVVDKVEHTEEIVVKPLHRALSSIPQLAGATVMGDGRVALILDVLGLADSVGLTVEELEHEAVVSEVSSEQAAAQTSLLIFALRSGRRLAIPLTEVDRLEDFPPTAIEHADGGQVVQYRNQIMPMVDLSGPSHELSEDLISEQRPNTSVDHAGIKAVVISDQGQSAALAVDRILDVVKCGTPIRESRHAGGYICGSAIIDGRVTEVVDVRGVMQEFVVSGASIEDMAR
ncbi:MAG: chemotaxis protein CheW [Rubripirellula sp.]